jgi:hypothetical protein
MREVGGQDVEDSFGDHPFGGAIQIGERDEERRRVRPDFDLPIVVNDLEAIESKLAPVRRFAGHDVAHQSGVHACRIFGQQLKDAVGHLQRLRRKRRTRNRSIDARLVRRVRQETIEIVGAHRHSELERRLVELATRFRFRVVVDDRGREMSAHRFGELNS